MNTWRDRARPYISDAIARVGTSDIKLLRKELRRVYPFGERKFWPYKVYLHEIRVQLGLTLFPKPRRSKHKPNDFDYKDPRQKKLFEGDKCIENTKLPQ